MQKTKYYRPYTIENGKRVYMKQGPNDIGMKSIPIKDRCDNFNELWNMIFEEVLSTWNNVDMDIDVELDETEKQTPAGSFKNVN